MLPLKKVAEVTSRRGHFLRAAVQNSLFLLQKRLSQLRSRPQACQLRALRRAGC